MKPDDLLIANVDAILKSSYASLPSDRWTWEKLCFSVARQEFGAPAGDAKRVSFSIRGPVYFEIGTSSDAWNQAVLAAAAQVRQQENPDSHDYSARLYEDPVDRRRAAGRIVQHLKAELTKSRLLATEG